MIFAHGLEFPLDKICLTFKWKDEETVKALDNLIVYLNRAVADKEVPSNLVDNVVCELKVMNISHNVIRIIANIEIERPNTFLQTCMDLEHLEIERQDKNKRSIQSIISILRTEQERHKRILEEETQKKELILLSALSILI